MTPATAPVVAPPVARSIAPALAASIAGPTLSTQALRRARWAGLLWPGGGQLRRGEPAAAAFVALAVLYFLTMAALELLEHNRAGFAADVTTWTQLAALRPPLRVVPDAVVAVLLAVACHVGAAWAAGRAAPTSHGTGGRADA